MNTTALKQQRNELAAEARRLARNCAPDELPKLRAIRESIHRLNREIAKRRQPWE